MPRPIILPFAAVLLIVPAGQSENNSIMSTNRIGIIGGSGLYHIDGFTRQKWVKLKTPFGAPSDDFLTGELSGREVAFLPRHGRGHRILPGELNHRANIYGMKKLGVQWIISVSAVGSLQARFRPRDVVLVDQFLDRTKKSPEHAFSTRAESLTNHKLGYDVIGMTNLSEAKCAREAEIAYATMAMITDYDCWKVDEAHVTVDMVIQNLTRNAAMAKEVVKRTISQIPHDANWSCHHALKNAIMTDRKCWPARTIKELKPLLQKYL